MLNQQQQQQQQQQQPYYYYQPDHQQQQQHQQHQQQQPPSSFHPPLYDPKAPFDHINYKEHNPTVPLLFQPDHDTLKDERISSTTSDQRFPEKRYYRDIVFLIAFLLHLIILVVIFGVGYSKFKNIKEMRSSSTTTQDGTRTGSGDGDIVGQIGGLGIFLGILLLFGTIFLSFLAIHFLRRFAKQMIYASFYFAFALCLVVGLTFIFTSDVFTAQNPNFAPVIIGIFFVVFSFLFLLIRYLWRNRIEFAAELLSVSASVINQFPATQWVALASTVPMSLFWIFWCFTANYAVYFESSFVFVYLIFSVFWTFQVIKNVVHVTTAGTFASWYFLSPIPENPTWESFKRSVTTSAGSICLGSLLVAIAQTLRSVSRNQNSGGNIIMCLIHCFATMIESILKYFNRYAFTQVAIYGKTYCEAGKSTWHLFREHGFEAIINDDLTSSALNMIVCCGSLVCALLGSLVGFLLLKNHDEFDSGAYMALAFASFLLGIVILSITLEVIDTGVATMFVCLAENPTRLLETHPEAYRKIQEKYSHCCDIFQSL